MLARQYSYYYNNAHSSPIDAPNGEFYNRYRVNPAFNNIPSGAEDIAVGFPNGVPWGTPGMPSAGMSVYSLMYLDGPGWGHRINILGSNFNWIGIGRAQVGELPLYPLLVLDFFQDGSPSSPYTPNYSRYSASEHEPAHHR
jgi:hypothetical protein